MKRTLFSIALLMAVSFSFAQVKHVKDAKSIANESDPDFAKAEKLIETALADSTTKDEPNTWNVAGYVQKKINEKEMEKAYLRKPYDTLKVYNSSYKMIQYFLKCDELAQIPNEKGKIKNSYRKTNAPILLIERPNLINGGIQYFNLNDNKKALEFFSTYIDLANAPMLEKENLLKQDTILSQIAYFACLAAAKMENYPSIIKYASYGANDKETGKYVLEFLTTAYKAQNDTVNWVKTLKNGLKSFPEYTFFFGNLIDYYSNNDQYDEAMAFADEMLANEPDNVFYLYVKAYLYHNIKDYDKAIEYYKKVIETDSQYAEAYSNLGLIYCIKAQEYSDKASTVDVSNPNYVKEQQIIKKFYEEARPCYEKARLLKPTQTDLWLQGLYRVYYNLGLGAEFEEIEKLLL
jgi:tetratricopeptide (TPR) repeat protein